jgi:DNA invertase Pin-like site-specific DNA recombinase
MATKPLFSAGVRSNRSVSRMETSQLRALSALRLSVLTDETTSPERQRAANEGAASAVGAEIIAEAVDLGVSASKTTPFERPELGSYLAASESFDVLLFWRFDRAVRSMHDLNTLVSWARAHRKVLVFAEGPGGRLTLDFRNGVDLITQLIIQIFAFAAEFEAQAIRDRVNGAQAAMRTMPLRWRGSRPPYGYVPVPLEGGGWTLAPAREAIPGCGPAPFAVIERIIRAQMGDPSKDLAGKTLSAIAEE